VSPDSERIVRLGEIAGVYGVRGWVKVLSFTEPRSNLFDYTDWLLDRAGRCRSVRLEAGREKGRSLVAKLAGVDDRDAALALIGTGIAVRRSELPEPAAGEFYWADLEGLEVRTTAGEVLGRVERLVATGANDVLVLDGERMIPFVRGPIVSDIDLAAGRIVVDWDASYWE
jgi:16S rRNA processing protein RimM